MTPVEKQIIQGVKDSISKTFAVILSELVDLCPVCQPRVKAFQDCLNAELDKVLEEKK